MLKEYGYIDWKEYGMKSCYFCKTPAEKYVGTAGAVLSGVIIAAIIPIVKGGVNLLGTDAFAEQNAVRVDASGISPSSSEQGIKLPE